MLRFLSKEVKLSWYALAVSIFSLFVYNLPLLGHTLAQTEHGLSGLWIIFSLSVIILAVDYLIVYLLVFFLKTAGKSIVALFLVINSFCLYFISSFGVMLTDSMMGNLFNTNPAEASSFISFQMVLCVLTAGVLPSVLLFLVKLDYGRIRRCLSSIGISLGVIVTIAGFNYPNLAFVHNNEEMLGGYLLPWGYLANSTRYFVAQNNYNRPEILLEDAEVTREGRSVAVLVIGESARRDHFSIYGYERETNPLLSNAEGLKAYNAESEYTYTIAGVKSILDYQETERSMEILPNYLFRQGVDVVWRTSNTGEPKLGIDRISRIEDLPGWNPGVRCYDGLLTEGLTELIGGSESQKMLVVLHTSTSHGPSYEEQYPSSFEVFSPVNTTAKLSDSNPQELINAYDNTIVYTDYILNSVIEQLKGLSEEWNCCMIYVSDHGESLGEGGYYMHGMTRSMAPSCQYEIPFIVWSRDPDTRYKDADKIDQHYVFHSIMHFLGLSSPFYNESKNVFAD